MAGSIVGGFHRYGDTSSRIRSVWRNLKMNSDEVAARREADRLREMNESELFKYLKETTLGMVAAVERLEILTTDPREGGDAGNRTG